MTDNRKILAKLLNESRCSEEDCYFCMYNGIEDCKTQMQVDHLLASGQVIVSPCTRACEKANGEDEG